MLLKYVKFGSLLLGASMLAGCSSSSSGGGTTTAGMITNGIDSSVTKIQSLGTAMSSGTSSFVLLDLNRSQRSSVHALNAMSSCDTNGRPGDDVNSNGMIDSGEEYNNTDNEYTLQSFYCAMAAETDGPEAVSGAVSTLKTVTCAVEEMLGAINFDGVERTVSEIRIDLSCATQADIDDMNGTTGETATVLPISATITAALNPTFSEIPNNTHFSHGIKIDGGSQLKFIVLAKFDASSGADPLENGDFEFATYGSGEAAGGGTGVEITAGRIERTSTSSGKLWYEFRANRLKSNPSDAICPDAGGSCGWSRHIRFTGDITFGSDGDIEDVSGFSGVIANGNEDGTGNPTDNSSVITAVGSLTTGISGQIWGDSVSALNDLISGDTLADLTAGTATCIISGGAIATGGGCAGAPSVLAPTDPIRAFLMPGGSSGNNGTWFQNLTEHGGLAYTGATTMADEQFATP